MVNEIAKLSQRFLGRAGRELTGLADRLVVDEIPSRLERRLLERNSVFKNRHKGQRCFVIGTGPSLKYQDISPLRGEVTYTMSSFWKHEIVKEWQPTYYCICDPIYFDGSQHIRNFFHSLTSRVGNSLFFIPLAGRAAVQEQRLLPLEHTYWVALGAELGSRSVIQIDLARVIPSPMTVSQLSLMLAIYMGCSPIYLLGLDHNWLSQPEIAHFYPGLAGLENHPEVKPELKQHSYRFILECALMIWKGYEVLLDLANRRGIEIFNATAGGCLDVFPRRRYEDIIGLPGLRTEQCEESLTR